MGERGGWDLERSSGWIRTRDGRNAMALYVGQGYCTLCKHLRIFVILRMVAHPNILRTGSCYFGKNYGYHCNFL